ncbi:MAG TPA: hypothetical protein VM734_24735 [Kofleriaceae bacterium]|jgi:hypothetical protein|nr:hypothetical protein [Kofleriaceae bacterium]
MPTTPRKHHHAEEHVPAPAASAGEQVFDTIDDEPSTDSTHFLDDDDTGLVEEAERLSSTEEGTDIGRESGELYGQGIAPTGDIDEHGVRSIQDFDEDNGEHWFEALEAAAGESGPAGWAPIDDVRGTEADDRRDHRDDPPADRGSGGPAGL